MSSDTIKKIIGYVLGAVLVISIALIPISSFPVAFGTLVVVLILWFVLELLNKRASKKRRLSR
jgi:hypothetical protein